MKILSSQLIALIFCSSSLVAQQQALPEDIGAFYQNSNFITAFSTHQERSFLVNFLEKEAPSSSLDEPRLAQIFHFMKAIQNQTVQAETMPNALQQNKLKFHSSELLKVEGWEYTPSAVVLKVRKYALPQAVNTQLIAHYEQYQRKNFVPLKDIFEGGLQTTALAIHTWRNLNGKWVKDSVEKVFLE